MTATTAASHDAPTAAPAPEAQPDAPRPDFDAVVVGAGFAGMHQLHTLRGQGLRVHAFEAGGDVGGTRYWNRYPGARVDIESEHYSYSFDPALEQEWDWSERYSAQPELLAYASHVADRFDLRSDITFDTRVSTLDWCEDDGLWTVSTDTGTEVTARFVVLATGCLSVPKQPEFPGTEDFTGEILYSANWPDDADLTGKDVAVIGTGSSGIQIITAIAAEVASLTVYRRTPNFAIPAHNRDLTDDDRQRIKEDYTQIRAADRSSRLGFTTGGGEPQKFGELAPEQRRAALEERWDYGGLGLTSTFSDTLLSRETNDAVAAFAHEQIRDRIDDPEVAELLVPRSFPIGVKRLCVDTGYFEVYNAENVTLVDLNEHPIEAITADGIRAGGEERSADVIVLATGFDAMTGAISRIDIRARGTSLNQEWEEGARTYLGPMTAGFPNLFLITGPQSPSVLTNMMTSIEYHVDYVAGIIRTMTERGRDRVEARPEAQDNWVATTDDLADLTLFSEAASWYRGANIPGKPRRFLPFPGGSDTYIAYCDAIALCGYHGFRFSPPVAGR